MLDSYQNRQMTSDGSEASLTLRQRMARATCASGQCPRCGGPIQCQRHPNGHVSVRCAECGTLDGTEAR